MKTMRKNMEQIINDCMNVKSFTMKRRKTINLHATKRFAVFTVYETGFMITMTDKPNKKGFMVHNVSGITTIPYEIRKAYGLKGDKIELILLSDDMFFFKGKCLDPMTKPFAGVYNVDEEHFSYDDLQFIGTTKVATKNKCSVTQILPDVKDQVVTMHLGKETWIELREADRYDKKYYPTLSEMKTVYGQNLQDFFGEKVTYTRLNLTDISDQYLMLPKIFRTKTGLRIGDSLNIYKTTKRNKNGRERTVYLLSLPVVRDGFTKDPIRPVEETPEKVTICDDCAEHQDDIAVILKQMESLKTTLKMLMDQNQDYMNTCESLMKQNESLKKTVDKQDKFFRSLCEAYLKKDGE